MKEAKGLEWQGEGCASATDTLSDYTRLARILQSKEDLPDSEESTARETNR